MNLSLKWKITLSLWLVAVVSTVASGALMAFIIYRTQERAVDAQLKSTASTLMSLGISDYSGLETFEDLDQYINQSTQTVRISHIIMVFNKKGKLLYSTIPDGTEGKEDIRKVFTPMIIPTTLMARVAGRDLKVLISPYEAKSGRDYYMLVAMPYPVYLETIRDISREGLILLVALSLLSFLLAQWLARVLTAPIREIAQYLSQVEPHDIRDLRPLALPKAGEYLQEIVTGVNTLTNRVKSTLYTMNRTSKFLAHELRNPLTILTGEADAVMSAPNSSLNDYRAVVESSLEEISRMNNVVDTVMKVFGKDKAVYHPVPTHIAVWLDENIPKWRKYLQREISWSKPEGEFLVLVDKDLLYRLIDNLIRNIKKHAGSQAMARIHLAKTSGMMQIVIDDTGFGMAPDLIKVLNEGNHSAEKVGIGLSLCLEIASICNFQLGFENQESGGLKVTIGIE